MAAESYVVQTGVQFEALDAADAEQVREAIGDALRYVPGVRRAAVAVAVKGELRDSVVGNDGYGGTEVGD